MLLLQQCTSVLPTDSRVMARMKELAAAGVRRVHEMQRHVQLFVNDLFAGTNVPPMTDARFWPNSKTVLNCIYHATKMSRFVTVVIMSSVVLHCGTDHTMCHSCVCHVLLVWLIMYICYIMLLTLFCMFITMVIGYLHALWFDCFGILLFSCCCFCLL